MGRQGRVVCWCVLPVSQCLFPGLWFVSVVEVLLYVVESGFLPPVVAPCVCPLLHPDVTFLYEPYYAGSSFAHTLAFTNTLAQKSGFGREGVCARADAKRRRCQGVS